MNQIDQLIESKLNPNKRERVTEGFNDMNNIYVCYTTKPPTIKAQIPYLLVGYKRPVPGLPNFVDQGIANLDVSERILKQYNDEINGDLELFEKQLRGKIEACAKRLSQTFGD